VFVTRVIVAAFSILYTYACPSPSLMPGGQKWGSNMFSPALKLLFLPQRRWGKFGVGCWHSTTPHTTTATNHLQPRKRIWTKFEPSIPSHTGDSYIIGDTKTQKRAKKAAAKKDKAETEAEQKHAVVSCKAYSQLKKREKLEAQAQKAAARAEALHIQLETSTPSTTGYSAHVIKKSKGSEGHTAVTSTSTQALKGHIAALECRLRSWRRN
jgi:hypothetical protein